MRPVQQRGQWLLACTRPAAQRVGGNTSPVDNRSRWHSIGQAIARTRRMGARADQRGEPVALARCLRATFGSDRAGVWQKPVQIAPYYIPNHSATLALSQPPTGSDRTCLLSLLPRAARLSSRPDLPLAWIFSILSYSA